MAAMDVHDEPDDLADDCDVTAHRARAAAKLGQIAQQARQALEERGIDIGLFFFVPHSGNAVLTFGTPGDPTDPEWEQVGTIVSAIVREATGIGRTRCREIACASTTDSITDRWHSPVQL